MKKLLQAIALAAGVFTLGLLMPQQAQAATLARANVSYEYYPLYDSNYNEWIAIPPEQISSTQAYWIVYPAALAVNSDGSYTIPGYWLWSAAGNLYYIPFDPSTIISNPNPLGTQQVSTSSISSLTSTLASQSIYTSEQDAAIQAEFDSTSLSQPDLSGYSSSTG